MMSQKRGRDTRNNKSYNAIYNLSACTYRYLVLSAQSLQVSLFSYILKLFSLFLAKLFPILFRFIKYPLIKNHKLRVRVKKKKEINYCPALLLDAYLFICQHFDQYKGSIAYRVSSEQGEVDGESKFMQLLCLIAL